MFTKRHEHELAEIKALTQGLGRRFQQILDELEQIKKAQPELQANAPSAARAVTAGRPSGGSPAGGSSSKVRSRQPSTSVVAGARDAKRQPEAATGTLRPGRPGAGTSPPTWPELRLRRGVAPVSPTRTPSDGSTTVMMRRRQIPSPGRRQTRTGGGRSAGG